MRQLDPTVRLPRAPAAVRGALVAFVLSAALAAGCGATAPEVRPEPPPGDAAAPAEGETVVAIHDRFETTFAVPGWTGHADDLLVDGLFETPSGRQVAVPGFAYRFASRGQWALRFTPTEAGRHTWIALADLDDQPGRETEVARGAFVARGEHRPGFVRRDPDFPYGLAFAGGEPFFVLGENRINIYDPSWNYEGLGITDYVTLMAESGMTTVRVFVFTDCEGEDLPGRIQLGCIEPAVGRFDEAQAARYDELFRAAEAHGVYVILTVFALGFTPGETWKSWEDNPYNAALGGPAADPPAFFTEEAARDAAERRLRYVAARWGYSPNLLAIDLLNEPEWDGGIGEETWIPWAEDMARRWQALDPYDHLITAGPVGLHWNIDGDERPWYASRWNDIVQWHLYGEPYYQVHALATELARKVAESLVWERPVLNGEFGYGGEDPFTHDHTHVGIWTTSFAGAGVLVHTAPQFTVDSDAPMTPSRRAHFRTLAAVLHELGERGIRQPLGRVPASPEGTFALALAGPTGRAIWVLAPEDGYGTKIESVEVSLAGLPPGRYEVRFLDDVTGEVLETRTLEATEAASDLRFPGFVRHAAALLVRE